MADPMKVLEEQDLLLVGVPLTPTTGPTGPSGPSGPSGPTGPTAAAEETQGPEPGLHPIEWLKSHLPGGSE